MISEHLDPVVFPIRHQDVAIGVDRDPFETLEFSGPGSPAPKASEEGSIGVKDLDPVVPAVSHENVTLVVNSNSSAKYFNQRNKILGNKINQAKLFITIYGIGFCTLEI